MLKMALETMPKALAEEEVAIAKEATPTKTEAEEVLKH
jgi:hypothetical protein